MKRFTTILCSLAFLVSGILLTATPKIEAMSQSDNAKAQLQVSKMLNPLNFQPSSVQTVQVVEHDTIFLSAPDAVIHPTIKSIPDKKTKKSKMKLRERPRNKGDNKIDTLNTNTIINPTDSSNYNTLKLTKVTNEDCYIVISLKNIVLPVDTITPVNASIVPSHTNR